METRITILNELKDISPIVAQAGFDLPYQVPQGYFENLAEMILQRIKTESLSAQEEVETLSPLLGSLSRKLPYEVPADYFSELSGNVVGGVKAIDFVQGELEHISPLMQGLRQKNVYEVPQGYFEDLPENILSKVRRQPAKVVSMNAGRRFMRYAAAAVIAGALAVGGWFYFNNKNTGVVDTQQLAGVEKISDDAKVTDKEMADFLANDPLPAVVSTVAVSEDINEADIKEMLTDVSDDELQQFLKTL